MSVWDAEGGSMARKPKPAISRADKDRTQAPRRRATTIATEGRLSLVNPSANARLFIYLAGHFLHRVELERRKLYFNDLDLALVAEMIGMVGVEPGMRDAGFRQRHSSFDSIVGVDGQRSVNATSIAIAAGIPRETVRRKIKQLLKLGFIVEKEPTRYVVKPGVLQQPERQAAFAHVIDQTVRFMNELLEHGLVQWVPVQKGRQNIKR